MSPALQAAIENYLKATQDPSRQCFCKLYPLDLLRSAIVEQVEDALVAGKTEAEVIQQLNAIAAE